MSNRLFAHAARIGWLPLLLLAAVASAEEIKVLSSNGVRAMLKELGPHYERTTGNKLNIEFDVANVLKTRIDSGEPFDVAILTGPALDELSKEGKVNAGTRADIARSGIGVAVRAGAPKPDISTVEAFKRTLLAAKSVAYTTQGASGIYFAGLLQRLGIAEEMKPKAKLLQGGAAAELVARGEAELAVQQISELLPVPGIDYVGPLPSELQNYTVFAAALAPNTKEAGPAASFIKFLTGPDAIAVIKTKGMERP